MVNYIEVSLKDEIDKDPLASHVFLFINNTLADDEFKGWYIEQEISANTYKEFKNLMYETSLPRQLKFCWNWFEGTVRNRTPKNIIILINEDVYYSKTFRMEMDLYYEIDINVLKDF